MQRSRGFILLAVVLAVGAAPRSPAGEPSVFERMTAQYESIRQSLLHDSAEEIALPAKQLQSALQELETGSADTGILPGGEDDLRALVPSIRAATAGLIEAETIADARDAFGALSEAMVRYRRLVPDSAPVVVFCPMAQKVWLQPKGEIGNPYYGQSMARCGEIVSE